eukprot:COSAG01_NODE_3283_length_6310_cov_8.652391_4_plen_82_part_00
MTDPHHMRIVTLGMRIVVTARRRRAGRQALRAAVPRDAQASAPRGEDAGAPHLAQQMDWTPLPPSLSPWFGAHGHVWCGVP